MQREGAEQLVRAYVDGWKAGSRDRILSTLATDCVVIECYGSVYRGLERVAQWIAAWFAPGSTVDAWDLSSFMLGASGCAVSVPKCAGLGHSVRHQLRRL